MSFRFITGVAVAIALASTPALACKGRKVLSSNDFAKEDSSWEAVLAGEFTLSGGRAQFKSEEGKIGGILNQGERAEGGDFCVDVIAPDYRGGGSEFAGLLFGFKRGGSELHALWVSPAEGTVGVTAKKASKWVSPVTPRKSDAVKQQSGAVNTLRLTWKGGEATAYVNDKQFANFKVPAVPDATFFGMYGQTEGKVWQFDNFKLTD
jgi:hypothetical protein